MKAHKAFSLCLSLLFLASPTLGQIGRPTRENPRKKPVGRPVREQAPVDTGEAVVQVRRDYAEIPLTLSPRGVLVIDYPKNDSVYFLHTNEKFLLIDRESRLEHDPIVVRAGDELQSGEKGDLGSAVLTVQMDSGLFCTFLISFTKSPKQSTHRVVLSYDPKDIVAAREKAGLFSGYQHMADEAKKGRQNSDTTVAAQTTAEKPVDRQGSGVSPVPVRVNDTQISPVGETNPKPKSSVPDPDQPDSGGPSATEVPLQTGTFTSTTVFEMPEIQTADGIHRQGSSRRISSPSEPPPLPRKSRTEIETELQGLYDKYRQAPVIQFSGPQNGLSMAVVSRGRLDATTAYVVVAVRNSSKQSLYLLSDQPILSLTTVSPKKQEIESRRVGKVLTIGTSDAFELKPDEKAFWAIAYPAQILGDNQKLQILCYHDTAANRPSTAPLR